jgi:hypothetical protein
MRDIARQIAGPAGRNQACVDAFVLHCVPACGPLHRRAAQVGLRLGVTVMIGQNDIRGERFTVANARGLTASPAATTSAGYPPGYKVVERRDLRGQAEQPARLAGGRGE